MEWCACPHKAQCGMKRASLSPLSSPLGSPLGSPAPHSLFDAGTMLFLVFHIECHVFPPHFVLSFDTFNFLLHFLCEFALCLLSINEFHNWLVSSALIIDNPFPSVNMSIKKGAPFGTPNIFDKRA